MFVPRSGSTTRPTGQMIQLALERSGYHAVAAKACLDAMCAMCARMVSAPPASLAVGTGREDVRSVIMLALHLNGFEEEPTAQVNPV